jgi:hypothetical protein
MVALLPVTQISGQPLAGIILWFVGVYLLWKEPSVKKGITIVFVLVTAEWVIKIAAGLATSYDTGFKDGQLSFYVVTYLHTLVTYGFSAVDVIIIRNVRRYLRGKYAIQPVLFSSNNSQEPSGDDFLLAWCLPCCTTAQMLRHTTDYKKYDAAVCSDRGVPPDTPGIL